MNAKFFQGYICSIKFQRKFHTIYTRILLLMKDFSLLLKHLKLRLFQYLIYCSKSVQIRIAQDIILRVAVPGAAK